MVYENNLERNRKKWDLVNQISTRSVHFKN